MMVHKEQIQFSNSNNGFGFGVGDEGGSGGSVNHGEHRFSKKIKQKKEPQRGLGVAQLEMMRMQELRKEAVEKAMLSSTQKLSSAADSAIPPPFINYPKSQSSSSSSSIAFCPPPSTSDVPSTNPAFMPPPSALPDNLYSYSFTPCNPIQIGRCNVGCWPSTAFPSDDKFPKLWWHPSDFHYEGYNPKSDHLASSDGCSVVRPLLDSMPRVHHQDPSQLLNVSSMNTLQQLEPPSNQMCYSNHGTSLREEKVMWMKQPRSFLLDNTPAHVFPGHFPAFSHPMSRSDESTSGGNGSNLNIGNAAPSFRETPPCLRGMPAELNSSKRLRRENVASDAEFLTLAPPPANSSYSGPKVKHPPGHISSTRDFSVSECLSHQGNAEIQVVDPRFGGSNHRPFFIFLAEPKKAQVVPMTRNYANGSSSTEVGEDLDLSLKL